MTQISENKGGSDGVGHLEPLFGPNLDDIPSTVRSLVLAFTFGSANRWSVGRSVLSVSVNLKISVNFPWFFPVFFPCFPKFFPSGGLQKNSPETIFDNNSLRNGLFVAGVPQKRCRRHERSPTSSIMIERPKPGSWWSVNSTRKYRDTDRVLQERQFSFAVSWLVPDDQTFRDLAARCVPSYPKWLHYQ